MARNRGSAPSAAIRGDPLVEIVHPVAHLAPVDRRPPGFPVIGSRPAEGVTDVGSECFDLGGVEDRPQVHEANPVQELPGLRHRVLEGEALREIHVASGFVLDAGRMVEVEEDLIAEGDPERRLPARHLAEAARTDRQLIGVQERETGLELPREGTPRVEGELDDRLRRARAGPDRERPSLGHVGVGPAVRELKPQRADDRGVGVGEDGSAPLEERRQLLLVEPVEIDRAEPFLVHGRNVAVTSSAAPGGHASLGTPELPKGRYL